MASFVAGALAGLGRRHDVALSVFALSWRGRGDLGRVAPPGAEVASRPAPARPLRWAWRRFDRPSVEWWTGPVDVVHGTNFVVPPTRRAAAIATVHDLTPVRFPELSTADTLQYPGLLRRALRRGAYVHASSAFVAGEVIELLGAAPDRVRTVAPGVPPVDAGDPAVGRRLAGADRYVLALGTVEPRKDLPNLVAAFDAVAADDADLRLVVAGPDGWGVEAFRAAVDAARHRDRIVRLGWVMGDERAGLLSGATVFAYPSLYEGFGYPPLEAMSVDVPVVGTTAGSLPEVLGDAALLVGPGDADALAGALVEALTDESMRRTLVARGRTRVAAYSWDRCAEGLVHAYREMAGA